MTEDGNPDGDTDIDRRRLVRLLIVLAIGVPILIEGVTFFSLVSHQLGGGGGTDAATTPTATEGPAGVGVGDELLAETPQRETVTNASVVVTEEGWLFTMTVDIENSGDRPYELRLRTAIADGTRVDSAATSGPIPPGETGTVTGAWRLPEGQRPDALGVATVTGDGGEPTTYRVSLDAIPVSY